MKRIIIVAAVLVVIIGGAIVALGVLRPATPEALPTPAPSQISETPSPEPTDSPGDGDSAQAGVAGVYVDYSDTAVANASGTRLLFFHAPWCPQCRAIESDILSAGVPDDVTIIKVDYDSHQDLRQQYGVTLQTTFVEVDAAGNSVQTFVAYENPTLQAVIDAML